MDFAIFYDLLLLNTLNKYTQQKLGLKYFSLVFNGLKSNLMIKFA